MVDVEKIDPLPLCRHGGFRAITVVPNGLLACVVDRKYIEMIGEKSGSFQPSRPISSIRRLSAGQLADPLGLQVDLLGRLAYLVGRRTKRRDGVRIPR
jgi:hypothetical protein